MHEFEKYREIFVDLLKIFSEKIRIAPSSYSDDQFERIILEIVNERTAEEFALFSILFDLIINNREKYPQGYRRNDLIYLFNNRPYVKKEKKKEIYQYTNYHTIIELVIETFSFISSNNVVSFDDGMRFDIFLSHKYKNKIFNLIVYHILTGYYGLRVYVDWIYDKSVNRLRVSRKTVLMLQTRMEQSCNFLFFNLDRVATSNWMAWEVGYFSGLRKGMIGILDLGDYYGRNRTSIEVLSSTERFFFNGSDIVEDKNYNDIGYYFKCR